MEEENVRISNRRFWRVFIPPLARETVLQVIQAKGMVSSTEYVRCRMRYFADGAALGSRAFVDGVFAQFRDRFGPTRQSGARTMTGLASEGLFTLRKLRLAVFG